MEFQELGIRERRLLLRALDFDLDKLKCDFCNKKTTAEDCCILPSVDLTKRTTILCSDILCLAEYFTALEANEEEANQ